MVITQAYCYNLKWAGRLDFWSNSPVHNQLTIFGVHYKKKYLCGHFTKKSTRHCRVLVTCIFLPFGNCNSSYLTGKRGMKFISLQFVFDFPYALCSSGLRVGLSDLPSKYSSKCLYLYCLENLEQILFLSYWGLTYSCFEASMNMVSYLRTGDMNDFTFIMLL